jgi:hypothetical protein
MWSIKNLEYRKSDGLAVAVIAEYKVTSGFINKTHVILVNLPEPIGDMIPFNELNEERVLAWVHANYDTETVENKVQAELDSGKEFETGKPW